MEFTVKFDSNTGRTAALLLGLIAVLGNTAVAQTSTTTTGAITLAAGAWSTNIQAKVNGLPSTELLQKVQMELAHMLPAGIRESAVANLNAAKTRVRATSCLTSQTAAAISSPAALFNTMSKMNPRCTFKAGRLTATTQHFTGSCLDPLSFTGNVTGKVIIDSPTTWRSNFSGTGMVPDLALQALALPPGTTVQMQTVATSKLTSATCPTTTTTVALAR
jgi:hypothetical protein